ncbi:metalloregulator ArsR/SmtB family transcription factor [Magnetovibrio sp. PR-2]|uniref:metalloregulator ArsR/SmtB family transcription factor n=1 Tax=Magnetovibrio sp. PR-2 TaxID=3120356 RepID=UPI003FA5332F
MKEPDQIFKLLSDPTRLRCVALIAQEGQLCVCEICYALDVSQPKVSRHLATLRKLGLLEDTRQGLWILYGLSPNLPNWVCNVIDKTVSGIGNAGVYAQDKRRLGKMCNRPRHISAA